MADNPTVKSTLGYGATLTYKDYTATPAGTETAINNLVDCDPPKPELDEVADEGLDSGDQESVLPAIHKFGTASLSIRYNKAQYAEFYALYKSKHDLLFKLTITGPTAADNAVKYFTGFVKQVDPTGKITQAGKKVMTVTIRCTSLVSDTDPTAGS